MVINTGLQSFHSRGEENGDREWRCQWSRPSAGAGRVRLCSADWSSVMWPQCKGAGNCPLLVSLRGKSYGSSELNTLAVSARVCPSGHQIPTCIVPPVYRTHPPQRRQLHGVTASSSESGVSRQCVVLPVGFGCGFTRLVI